MLTLYTAIGTLKLENNGNGRPTPIIINNRQEYGLCEHELLLWSCLAFQILQIHELETCYQAKLAKSRLPEGLALSHYLNRLILRGLVAKGSGISGVDALYGLLGELHIQPVRNRFGIRALTCIRLLIAGKITCGELVQYLRKETYTPVERTVLQLTGGVALTTAELVTCIDRGRIPASDQEVMEKLYDDPADTYKTLAVEAQIHHVQYPVLQAVGNLYLNKQIIFQKL